MIEIHFDFEPMPFNNYQRSTRTGRRYTTEKGRDYVKQIESVLDNRWEDLKYFSKEHQPQETQYILEINYFKKNYLTKKGLINKRHGDVDGPGKVIVDTLFRYLGYDDVYLKKVTQEKHTSERTYFSLKLSLYGA